ncbi:hypothetical protein RYA05_01200 [Pseudomonas syringae pv. actinidiae]|nr:hypothetical protein [Pseudomonas syringae pv. actinidiae]
MPTEIYKMVYSRLFELYELDQRSTEINLECVGGEPTFLPYEYWEDKLPYSLEMARKIKEKTGRASPFIFNTNFIIRDQRYFDMFNQYGTDDSFELFISWEPDTQRYGSRDKLYKKYVEGIEKVGKNFKTLSLVATKALVEADVKDIIDNHVIAHNFQDIAVAMLFQFGSGKEFFKEHMPTFSQISQFYINLVNALPETMNCDGEMDTVTLSPYEEVKQSLLLNRSFQFMGNDHFDLEVEPDGTTSFNSSMTGSESQMPARVISIRDENWPIKVLFENTPMLNKKLNGRYDFCRQCKYHRYCLGGYYHYKLLDAETINILNEDGTGDCPGYKKLWEFTEVEHAAEMTPIHRSNHDRRLKEIMARKPKKLPQVAISNSHEVSETSLMTEGYVPYLTQIQGYDRVFVDRKIVFSKSLDERFWFFDSLGVQPVICADLAMSPDLAMIVENTVYGNYRNIQLSDDFIVNWMNANPDLLIVKDMKFSLSVVKGFDRVKTNIDLGPTISMEGFYVDDRNAEMFEWAFKSTVDIDAINGLKDQPSLSKSSYSLIENITELMHREDSMARLLNAQ